MLNIVKRITESHLFTLGLLIADPVQSGASSQAKIGGAYFSDVTGSIQYPIAVPGLCEVTEF